MAVPYTFGSATTSIPLSQLDSNFATAITLGNTAVQLGNTITNLTGVSNVASATSLSLGSNGNTTAVTIDTSQNVAVGTTTAQITGAGRGNITLNGSSSAIINLSVGDVNKGQFYHGGTDMFLGNQANGYLAFQSNATERMRIDSSGNVGIGTTSNLASSKLDVRGVIRVGSGTSAGDAEVAFSNYASATSAWNISVRQDVGGANNDLKFLRFNSSGVYQGVAMQLDSSGNLLVGTTSENSNLGTRIHLSGNSGGTIWAVGPTTGSYNTFFIASSGSTGVQLANTSATSWSSNSDERLKTDLIPIENAISKVTSLRAVTGRYKTDAEGLSRAFLIAQDVQAVLPEAVSSSPLPNSKNGIEYLNLAYTETIPLLVAAIKELKAINDTQAETINALTARVVALVSK